MTILKILINIVLPIIISLIFIIAAPEVLRLTSFIRENLFESIMVLGLVLSLSLLVVINNRMSVY